MPSCCHSDHEGHPPANTKSVAKYICPMCEGVESDKPGACPKCGMELELNPRWRGEPRGPRDFRDERGNRGNGHDDRRDNRGDGRDHDGRR